MVPIVVYLAVEVLFSMLVCATMWRVADADNRSPLLWSGITASLCFASLTIPVPFIHPLIAGLATLMAMFVVNLIRLPPL